MFELDNRIDTSDQAITHLCVSLRSNRRQLNERLDHEHVSAAYVASERAEWLLSALLAERRKVKSAISKLVAA